MRRLLILLYPASWRVRYGDELAALMEDAPGGWRADFDLLKGAMKMRLSTQGAWAVLMGFVAAGALAGLGVSYLVTPMWEAKAVLQCTPARVHNGDDGLQRARQRVLEIWNADVASDKARLTMMARGSKAGAVIFTIDFLDRDAQKAVDTTNRLIGTFEGARGSGPDTVFFDTLDRPVLPRRPIFPKRESFIVAGGITGLILAGGTLIVRRRRFGQGPGLQLAP